MSKIVYVGPTIPGVATRNTTYSEMPESLKGAAKTAPYLNGLCVPVKNLSVAMEQIRHKEGAFYTLYNKALTFSANAKGAN